MKGEECEGKIEVFGEKVMKEIRRSGHQWEGYQ